MPDKLGALVKAELGKLMGLGCCCVAGVNALTLCLTACVDTKQQFSHAACSNMHVWCLWCCLRILLARTEHHKLRQVLVTDLDLPVQISLGKRLLFDWKQSRASSM